MRSWQWAILSTSNLWTNCLAPRLQNEAKPTTITTNVRITWGEHLMQTADGFKRSEIGSTSTTLIWDGGDYLQGEELSPCL